MWPLVSVTLGSGIVMTFNNKTSSEKRENIQGRRLLHEGWVTLKVRAVVYHP